MDRGSLLKNEPSSSFRSCETDQTQEASSVLTALEGTLLKDYIAKNEIFDLVFRLLDQDSLMGTRLVCRKWNNLALKILSETPELSELLGNMKFCFEDDGSMDVEGLENVKKLQSILRFSECPEMFFSELILESGVLVGDIQLLNLLQKFGSTLKSLELRDITLNLPILRPILENWCVNLEELTLGGIGVNVDNNITVHDFQALPTPLKLKLRKFKAYSRTEPHPAGGNFIVSIIKSSPKLQVLHVEICAGQLDFWRNLQNIPEITKNLEEIQIVEFGYGMKDLSLISDVSFSNKLTSLTLIISDPIFPQEQLFTFLEKVRESLQTLHLSALQFVLLDEVQHSSWKIKLPWMNKLKALRYCVYNELLIVNSSDMDFLKKLPNLEILSLSLYHGTAPSEFLDAFISNSSYLPRHPHSTLNTLSIRGSSKHPIGIGNPENIFKINRMLPNLHNLTLEFQTWENSESKKEIWLTRIFTGFSEMKNLIILDLIFPKSLTWNHEINFEACFSPLTALEKLEQLEITKINFSPTEVQYFPPGLENVFVRIPKLKVLTLQNFKMKISESIKLFKTLDQKGILLKAYENFS